MKCLFKKCDRSSKVRDYCKNHYRFLWRKQQLLPLPKKTKTQRFWEYVNKTNTCWLWIAAKDKNGYGVYNFEKKLWKVHRLSLKLFGIKLKPNLQIDHLCLVKNCLNPQHLEQVTPAENHRRCQPRRYKPIMTHCKNGHEYTKENTLKYLRMTGETQRHCRICNRERCRKRYYQTPDDEPIIQSARNIFGA